MGLIAFIPFRSGSTRLPKKNIKLLGGIPLTSWSLMAALRVNIFDKIILSSDSNEYLEIIVNSIKLRNEDKKKIIFDNRQENFSNSKSKIFDYLKFGLSSNFAVNEDLVVQLLPTCPFRDLNNLKKSIMMCKALNLPVFSCIEYDFRLKFAFLPIKNSFQPLFEDSPMVNGNTQSQSHLNYFHPCGSFNIFNMGYLRDSMRTIYHSAVPITVSRSEAIDIDTLEDFNFADAIAPFFKKKIFND